MLFRPQALQSNKERIMSNVSDLKPWFRDDIERLLISIYFTSAAAGRSQSNDIEYQTGFASALSSIALMVGVDPKSFLTHANIQEIHQDQARISSLDNILQGS